MKKCNSLVYKILHFILFICAIIFVLSIQFKIRYLSNYQNNQTDFTKTTDFNDIYIKYIQRLTLYVHYSDSGYIADQSAINNMDDILLNDDIDFILNDNLEDRENFEFYNHCLNIRSTNFLYYVKNTTTGKVYASPYLDFLYPNNIEQFTSDVKTNPAFFLINTSTGKYTTSLTINGQAHLKQDLDWMLKTLSSPSEVTSTNQEFKNTYIIYTGILNDFSNQDDEFYYYYNTYKPARLAYDISKYSLPISAILFVAIFLILIYQTGHQHVTPSDDATYQIHLTRFDLIYSDLVLVGYIVIYVCQFMILRYFLSWYHFQTFFSRYFIGFFCFNYILGIFGLFSAIRRIKARTLIKNTLIFKGITKFRIRFKDFFHHQNITFRFASILALFIIIQCFAFVCYWYTKSLILLFFLFLISYVYLIGVFLGNIIDYAKVLDYLKKAQEESDLTQTLETNNFTPMMKELGGYINNIQLGLSAAVAEQTKSERFKVELITNVSHDIKTPLTSIINYVDLLKKEPHDSKKIKEYLDILTNKSWRLKTLIEDLVEASKASSGAIKMHPEKLNLVELVKQAAGEFDDRFQENQLEVIIGSPNQSVLIFADGRSTFRIIDNLFSNVNKYAMKGTRVYVDIETIGSFAYLLIKNISNQKLNISPEELMERFVRGDVSRNTEGSGLGLSISRSLTTLQGGTFDINVDGDLFKVTVALPLIDNNTIEPTT